MSEFLVIAIVSTLVGALIYLLHSPRCPRLPRGGGMIALTVP